MKLTLYIDFTTISSFFIVLYYVQLFKLQVWVCNFLSNRILLKTCLQNHLNVSKISSGVDFINNCLRNKDE